MNSTQISDRPRLVADEIPGYEYGTSRVARSPITVEDLELLKESAGFTQADEVALHAAGNLLAGHTKEVVDKWRAVISSHPHLARYSLRSNGEKSQKYSEASGLRFQQWVLDT
ncbi:MAG: protoglobin domain-containing protein, partial [Candidatus Angelobacter sp.]